MRAKSFFEPKTVTIPQIGLIAGTRGALGAGIALLLADSMSREQRRAIGWTLVAVGALTTIPLAAQLFGGCCSHHHHEEPDEHAAT